MADSSMGGRLTADGKNDGVTHRNSSPELAENQHTDHVEVPAPQAAVAPKRANPAPLGLLGFGMTTIILNVHNAGLFPLSTVVMGLGICYGGIAQFLAGILEYTRGNTFAFIAFTSYGSFWVSLVCAFMLPNNSNEPGFAVSPTDSKYLAVYLLVWGIFTFFMFFCTLRSNLVLMSVFATLFLLFVLLAAGNFGNSTVTLNVAGYEGIVCGSLAFYLGIAEVVNEVFEGEVMPIFAIDFVKMWRRRA